MLIDTSEWQDFERILEQRGLTTEDFDTTVTQDERAPANISPVWGEIAIRRKNTDKVRVYRCGRGAEWVADFDKDLAAGRFDNSRR